MFFRIKTTSPEEAGGSRLTKHLANSKFGEMAHGNCVNFHLAIFSDFAEMLKHFGLIANFHNFIKIARGGER